MVKKHDDRGSMLLPFSHIGFVFCSVYCLASLLFLSVVYAWTFVLGSATLQYPSDVVKMFTLNLCALASCPTFLSGI